MSEQASEISRPLDSSPLEIRDDVREAEPATSRPGVIQLAIKEKTALSAAYMPFVAGGGLFIPTTRPGRLGDEIYIILSLMDDPAKIPITGKIVWITPAGTPGRQQGIGVQFSADDAGSQARAKIENQIGGSLKSVRQTHTI
ncbi:MAG: PilZ domain-containing protein [Burkholderiaceae bacterium]